MVVEVLVHGIVPGRYHFNTGVADLTLVHHHGVKADGLGPTHSLFLNQVESTLVIIVHGEGEAILEQVNVQTGIPLLGSLPGEVLVYGILEEPEGAPVSAVLHTVDSAFVPGAAAQDGRFVIHIHGAQITYAAPGSTDLQEVHHVVLGEERFAGNLPGGGYGREVSVVMTLRQTAGIVTAIGSGHKVAVVIAVGSTGDKGHVGIH